MPGFLGIVSAVSADDAARRFDAGRARLLRAGAHGAATWVSHDGRARVVSTQLAGREAVDAELDATRRAALVQGVLYEPAGTGDAAQFGDALAAQLDADLVAGLDRVRGEFSLVLIDPIRRRLILATDATGNYPVYWRADQDAFVFSSDLSALLRAVPSARTLDASAVADYLTIGAVLGRKTLVKGVEVLDPGTALVHHLDTGATTTHPYVELARFFEPSARSREDYLREVKDTFAQAVARASSGPQQLGLSLSGGLDSRAILSGLNGKAPRVRTYTLGVAGCADQVIAERLSQLSGTQHTFFELDRSYLRDFLPNMAAMVAITDGLYLSHGLTEMLAVQFLQRTGIEVLLRGHGGELAKARLAWPLHTDDQVYRLSSASELVGYLAPRANYITRGRPLGQLLRPDVAALAGPGSSRSFAQALEGRNLSPAAACSYLYLRELHRRFTVPSLELFRTQVEVRMPYVDRDFLGALLACPPEWRDDTAIHKALTAAGLPQLVRVRNSNTGAPADASPRTEFVLDKMNSLLKRLNVYGYRHYHDFDGWMRTMLLESVQAELLRSDSRVQAFVAPETLQQLLAETRDGRADHAYLLQILLILELWQRENGVSEVG